MSRKQSDSVSSLETHLGYWLRLVSNHVSHEFSRKLLEREVTVAEWVVLRKLLEAAPLAPSQLAEALGLTRGAISKLNDRLAQKGLVEIAASRSDARQQVVSLTRRGQALVPQLAAIADANDREFFGVLSASELATLRKLMLKLVRAHALGGTPID
jgi:DNA-binding MarR family transcriptional regulator